jgi:hypothetical protein
MEWYATNRDWRIFLNTVHSTTNHAPNDAHNDQNSNKPGNSQQEQRKIQPSQSGAKSKYIPKGRGITPAEKRLQSDGVNTFIQQTKWIEIRYSINTT